MITYREVLRYIGRFIRPQLGIFIAILLLDFTWALDALIWPYILHRVVDVFTLYNTNRLEAWDALKGPIIGAIFLVIYIEIASRTMGFLFGRALPKLEADIRMDMFDHIQRHSPKYFMERLAGALANKITDMTTHVSLILQQLWWPIFPAFVACLLGSVFLWFIHPLFTGLMLLWTCVHIFICLKFVQPVDVLEQRHGEARSHLSGKIVDSLTNYFAVNLFFSFQQERKMLSLYQAREEKTNRDAKYYVEKLNCFFSAFYFAVVVLGVNGMLVYFWLTNRITTGEVVQVFTTMWSLVMILWTIGRKLPEVFQSFGILKQAYRVLRDPQDILDRPGAQPLVISSGEILFDDVSFHYGERKLFHNKHVRIRGGEKVGLVGYTGAGKSTFIHLILRFYPLESGKILLDGQDIADKTLESIRRQIALIPQDPILFHRSLRENICYGKPNASEEEMHHAAKQAHCEEFISIFPKGYDTVVGERGTKLSGGEKQRIAIARAILEDAPILILDEATSSLDSLTERYIQDCLDTLMKNRTTLVIAHRLSTLSRMDRILVFDKGKIVEEGSHSSLIAKGGLYSKMWNMQMGGFLPENPH
ncbi:MAG TPA: ABC transporter ATP-binding protein [Rhabdochlamydiaceae bacterium]|jgi:ATP-binding cassette subfamily B protein